MNKIELQIQMAKAKINALEELKMINLIDKSVRKMNIAMLKSDIEVLENVEL